MKGKRWEDREKKKKSLGRERLKRGRKKLRGSMKSFGERASLRGEKRKKKEKRREGSREASWLCRICPWINEDYEK